MRLMDIFRRHREPDASQADEQTGAWPEQPAGKEQLASEDPPGGFEAEGASQSPSAEVPPEPGPDSASLGDADQQSDA